MKSIFVLVMVCIINITTGQNRTSIWVGGISAAINFNSDTAVSFLRADDKLIWRTSASICDSLGDLLFYTNGFRVFNKNYEIMENGDSLDIGDYMFWGYDLLSAPDGALILPIPGLDNQFYVFHLDLNFIGTPLGSILYPTHLFYSIIDLSTNSGLGSVSPNKKNVALINDTLAEFGMKAVKHGNGRDWWLMCHEYGTNGYYTFLIDSLGIHGPFKQEIGIKYELYNAQIASIMKFSEEGNKLLHLTFDSNQVELFDFDRCTGELYNYNSFKFDAIMAYSYGASFSPSGRYIYVSINFEEIRQYDLEATDIAASQVLVGTDDGIADPFPAHYFLHQLAPDGKIYVVSYDGAYSLHVINHPDSAGLACNFVQRGFPLVNGSQWVASAPNVVNYSLGPLEGSECDTLVSAIQSTQSVFTFGLYPNPCFNSAQLSLSGATEKAEIFLYNTFGQLLFKTIAFPSNNFIHTQLPVRDLVAGIYLVKVSMGEKEIAQKLVKR